MRLSEVRQGMRCTGLSVVRGVTISSFNVEILDVVTGDKASAPRILVRVSGPAVTPSGVGPGFSGSPIYCPDGSGVRKNAGAISETLGSYGNDVVLATPIEQVLGQGPDAPRSARRDQRLLSGARRLATPLTISGLSAPMRDMVTAAARRVRRPVLVAPAGPAAGYPVQDLRPGAAMASGLATGDIAIGSIGTVTYRDGPVVWAFGHELDAAGARSLPLQDAYVFSVINNPVGLEDAHTYKFAVSGHTVGTLSNDSLEAVVGRVGAPPRMIPLATTVRDLDTGRSLTTRSRLADERSLELGSSMNMVGTFSLGQGSRQLLGVSPPRVSSRLCLRIKVAQRRRPLGFCNSYVDQVRPMEDASTAFQLVDSFKFGRLTPRSVTARLGLRRGVPEAFLVSARAPRRVRAGRKVRISLLVQERRSKRRRLTVSYRVPRSTPAGRRTITLRGAVPQPPETSLQERLESALEPEGARDDTSPGPRSVAELAAQVASLRTPEGLRVSVRAGARGRVALPLAKLWVRGKLRVPVVVSRPRR